MMSSSWPQEKSQKRPNFSLSPKMIDNVLGFSCLVSIKMNCRSDTKTKARQHLIFLSHSGHDKPFVRKLYDALCHAGHDPFFDTHSLPAGEPFPPASGCRLGVVVLSPNFLTSRWPMMELHSMHTSLSAPIILPLFFRLNPDDVKPSSPLFAEWRNAWQTLEVQSPSRVNLTEWEAATKNLAILNGVVYEPDKGEDFFIQKTLHHICSVVHPPLRYKVSHVIGCERLTQEVATLFEEIPSSSHFQARAIGFHGVAGQGKTTICQLMVHHYATMYAGRCTIIELPSPSSKDADVLNQCKIALRQLTNSSDSRINWARGLDECLMLLERIVAHLDVFIAVDNVWENYLEFAQRIVDIRFSKGSKLLVMSRSRQVLTNLLKDSRSVRPLPSVNKDEARQIFINSFNRNHCTSLHVDESYVNEMAGGFKFNKQYHPLGISALGVAIGRTGKQAWPATCNEVRRVFGRSDNVVVNAIKVNFDSVPKIRREMFLDVALIFIPMVENCTSIGGIISDVLDLWSCFGVDVNFDHLHTWLGALYKGRMDELEIARTLMQLSYDGLLDFKKDCFGGRKVNVHDLYKDLARQEGVESGAFLVQWTKVERMVLRGHKDHLGIEAVRNLQLIMAENVDFVWRTMPQLRILKLGKCKGKHLRLNWKEIPHLTWLELGYLACELDIARLSNLLVLELVGTSLVSCRQLCLECLVGLQFLVMFNVKGIEEIRGLDSLMNLKCMRLIGMKELRKVGVYSAHMKELQVLELKYCDLLEEVEGVCLLPNLKVLHCAQRWLWKEEEVEVQQLKSLQSLHLKRELGSPALNFRGASALQSLQLHYSGLDGPSLGYFRGASALQSLQLHYSGLDDPSLGYFLPEERVKKFASTYQLPSLESIYLQSYTRFRSIPWLSFYGLLNLKCILISTSSIQPFLK